MKMNATKLIELYYTLVSALGPRLHQLIFFGWIFINTGITILFIVGMVAKELIAGNINFLLDWGTAINEFYSFYIVPFWAGLLTFFAISIPITAIIIGITVIITILVLVFIYNVAFPKIYAKIIENTILTDENDNEIRTIKEVTNTNGPYIGRMLYTNDSTYWLNRLIDIFPKIVCKIKKQEWTEPDDRLETRGELAMDYVFGLKSFARAIFMGIKKDDRFVVNSDQIIERGWFDATIESLPNSYQSNEGIRDTMELPQPIGYDNALLKNASREALANAHDGVHGALKSNADLCWHKERSNVYLEPTPEEIERNRAEMLEPGTRRLALIYIDRRIDKEISDEDYIEIEGGFK